MTANIEHSEDPNTPQISCEERLKMVLEFEGNRVCAECPEKEPTWACLLNNPLDEQGPRLGLLCCYKCYGHLFRLAKHVGQVKSTRRAHEWSEEEVAVLASTGNQIVNEIYEAKLTPDERAKAQEDMEKFVKMKYQDMKYFSKKTFNQRFKATPSSNFVSTTAAGMAADMLSLGTKLTTPSFDWSSFSKGSKPEDEGQSNNKSRSPSRGVARALSSRTAKRDKDSGLAALAKPSLGRAVSNSFGFDKSPSNIFSKMMGAGISSTPATEGNSNSQDQEEEEDNERRPSREKEPLSNPYDVNRMREDSNAYTDDEDQDSDDGGDGSGRLRRGSRRHAPRHRGVRTSKSNSNLDFLRQAATAASEADDDASLMSGASQMSGRYSRSRRVGKSMQRVGKRNSNPNNQTALGAESFEDTESDDTGMADSRRRVDSRPRMPRQPSRRGVRPSASSPLELAAMRKEASLGSMQRDSSRRLRTENSARSLSREPSSRQVKRQSSRASRRGERIESDKSSRRSSKSRDRNGERQQPSSLLAKLDGESEAEEDVLNDNSKHRTHSRRKGKSDGLDKSGRSSRGEQTRGKSEMDESRGDRSKRGERSHDKGKCDMDGSKGDRSRRGERSRDRKGKSDGMDKSSRGDRSKSRHKSKDKPPKRRSDGSRKKSPRRAVTEPSERNPLKTIRRQLSNPSSLLDETDVEGKVDPDTASVDSAGPAYSRTRSSSSCSLSSSGSKKIRRRSSGRLQQDSEKPTRTRRRSSGNRIVEDEKKHKKRSSHSPKPSRRKNKESTENRPEKGRKPGHRQGSSPTLGRTASGKVQQGITELASLIITTREMEKGDKKSGTFNSSDSSFLDVVQIPGSPPSSPGSSSSAEEPSSPSNDKTKRGSGNSAAIHSLRSPGSTWKAKVKKIPKMGLLDDDTDESSDSSTDESDSDSSQKAKRKGKHSKHSRPTKKSGMSSKSERGGRTVARKHKHDKEMSRSERGGRMVDQKPSTIGDTIMALKAMDDSKATLPKPPTLKRGKTVC